MTRHGRNGSMRGHGLSVLVAGRYIVPQVDCLNCPDMEARRLWGRHFKICRGLERNTERDFVDGISFVSTSSLFLCCRSYTLQGPWGKPVVMTIAVTYCLWVSSWTEFPQVICSLKFEPRLSSRLVEIKCMHEHFFHPVAGET